MMKYYTIENLRRAIRLVRIIRSKGRLGPLSLEVCPTSACNFNCFFCEQHSPARKEPKVVESMPIETIKTLLDEAEDMGVWEVLFSGNGEPFLHPDILEIIDYCRMKVKICTNGSKLDMITKDIFRKIHKLTISLNSINEYAHKYIHGYRGQSRLPWILQNIKRLMEYLNARKKIQINYVRCESNKNENLDKYDWNFVVRPVSDPFRKSVRIHSLMPCYAGFYSGYIKANGDYHRCVHDPIALGNINSGFGEIYRRMYHSFLAMTKAKVLICSGCYRCRDVEMYSKTFDRIYRYRKA